MAKVGRPKSDNVKDKVVSVRMTPEQLAEIKKYADASKKTVTQVILEGVDVVMKKK